MPEQGDHRGPGERQSIAVCLRNLDIARGDLRNARPGRNDDVLRAELLAALEGYAAAIAETGVPIPRTLRNEIELYRGLRDRP
jgi:hypothetical protein